MKSRPIKFAQVENFTGYQPHPPGYIPELKRSQYFIIDHITVSGDAPKELLKVYEYGDARKINRNKWNLYIAKTGHKWYPNESITEFLLFRLGQCFGLNMAHSRLVRAGRQIRFMSKYFLSHKNQQLVHGAEIFAGYVEDKEFVEQVEKQKLAREFFSVQFAFDAIFDIFKEDAEKIFTDFMKMLIFDAWVGNNDRHFYNWGVVRHVRNDHRPYFSPVYDSARGLFWNDSEAKIVSLHQNKSNLETFLQKYINNSIPKISWDGEQNINHFKLVELIAKNEIGIRKEIIEELLSNNRLLSACTILKKEFYGLMSRERIALIKMCLEARHEKLAKILKDI